MAPITNHSICILALGWPVDQAELGRLQHTRVAIQGRLDRSWIGPVCLEIEQRRPDLIMTHGFNAHFVAWTCQRRLRRQLPVVCSYHGPYHPANLRGHLLGMAYERFSDYFLRRHALAVVAVAHHAKARLAQRRVPVENVTVIHNGIESNAPSVSPIEARGEFRAQWGAKPDDFLVGAVGRLAPVKGFRHLIEGFAKAAQRWPRLRLVIAGDGPERPALENSIRRSGVGDRIRLLGTVSGAAATLAAVDLFVVSSLSECHSIALLEAMRAALPIVATDVGGNPETIASEREGLLVPAGNPEALDVAIERLVAAPELCRCLGEAARQRFLHEFTQDVMLNRTAEWLLACAEKGRSLGSQL